MMSVSLKQGMQSYVVTIKCKETIHQEFAHLIGAFPDTLINATAGLLDVIYSTE